MCQGWHAASANLCAQDHVHTLPARALLKPTWHLWCLQHLALRCGFGVAHGVGAGGHGGMAATWMVAGGVARALIVAFPIQKHEQECHDAHVDTCMAWLVKQAAGLCCKMH